MFTGLQLRGLELGLKAPEVLMAPLRDMEPVRRGFTQGFLLGPLGHPLSLACSPVAQGLPHLFPGAPESRDL